MGDESGGESLEEPIELESGEELSTDHESEDFNRWLDDLDREDLSREAEDGMDDDGGHQGDDQEPEEGAAKRQRVDSEVPQERTWPPEGYVPYGGGPPRPAKGDRFDKAGNQVPIESEDGGQRSRKRRKRLKRKG